MNEDTLTPVQTVPGLPAVITGNMPPDRVRQFWLNLRKSWLDSVDTIEKMLGISPTTAEIRAMWREARRRGPGGDTIGA